MAVQIQFRRDTAANWTSENPTLAAGELGYETDTGNIKIGDGSTAWTSLAYNGVSSTYVDTAVSNLVDTAPDALNTLNELAAALGDDASFSTTVTNSIATKVSKTNGTVTTAATDQTVVRNITLSTSAPSGGSDGDVWLQYTA